MTLNPLVAFQAALGILPSKPQRGITTSELANFSSYVVAVMPEAHAEGYDNFLQKSFRSCHQDTVMRCLAIMIYFASNNLRFPTDAAYATTRWLFLPDNLNVLRHLLSIEGFTTEALAEYLFGFAVEAENMMAIKTILRTGLNPNSSRTKMCLTPLQHASKTGNLELARLLLDAGAKVNMRSSSLPGASLTPLMLAVQTRRTDLVNLLIAAGASVNTKDTDDGDSALMIATKLENIDLVQTLILAGADVNCVNFEGKSVISLAVGTGSTELIQYILDAGSEEMGSAVVSATSQGDTEIIQLLLDAGGDIDYPSGEGLTALTVAIMQNNPELAEFLLRKGANVNGSASRPSSNRGCYRYCPCSEDIPRMTPLQATSLRDMTKLARILLEAGADVNTPIICLSLYETFPLYAEVSNYGDGYLLSTMGNALQIAVLRQNQKLAKLLLDAGADVNAAASKPDGKTALQAAVEKGDKYLVKCLLEAGANVNAAASEEHGRTALQAAVEKGDKYLIECLLDAGADINGLPGKVDGVTVLTAAVKRRDFDLISLLLNAGANINHPSAGSSGGTALGAAVMSGDINLFNYLLSNGAHGDDPDALFSAVVCGKIELIPILLAAREKIDDLEGKSCGYNALQAAIEREQLEVVQTLLAAGIDVNHPPSLCDKRGCWHQSKGELESSLHAAINEENVQLVRILLEAGADPNVKNRQGEMPLHYATREENIWLVQILLEAGADVNLPSAGGLYFWGHGVLSYSQTSLQAAALRGNSDIVEVLLKAGANVNFQSGSKTGFTALQSAAIGGFFEIARMLLNENAEVNAAASQNGRTALEGAAEYGRIDIVQLLLNAGAEIEGTGQVQYHRALDFAAKRGHYAVCRLLRSFHDSRYGTSDSTDI